MFKRGSAEEPMIVLIDGQCNLCQSITKFIIKRDPNAKFRFASLQSERGRKLLLKGNLSVDKLDTFVLIDSGRYYTKSTAALRLLRKLGGVWSLFYVLRVIPSFVRNRVYDWIARKRYLWFGYNDSCLLPTEDTRKRFLSDSWDGD
ncbi:thiol-disulfide oxidoreductase DCC family protein [Cohnella silvisoli]|uniref:DCC1-like thiol-disulfide oxidoreductase family protein n=1 Tax=Cohnella silvisoli TaxID=2873699 RepID=A0ABV1KUZ8_9BACL|nr:DCC1-like thiol-disulfide oxidoreductase family protein [Cohnella silvisoli]MCD9023337.1 DCC1-like thiol-disulfide oxidoreductase family protein [Cohnella silvisoli]